MVPFHGELADHSPPLSGALQSFLDHIQWLPSKLWLDCLNPLHLLNSGKSTCECVEGLTFSHEEVAIQVTQEGIDF